MATSTMTSTDVTAVHGMVSRSPNGCLSVVAAPARSVPLRWASIPAPPKIANHTRLTRLGTSSAAPFARPSPMSGAKAALISCERPLRKTPYAIAMPTTA